MKLRVKDKVIVIRGKDAGKESTVEKTYPTTNKVVVKGLNIYKKHVKKSEAFPQGGVVEISRSLPAGNVMLVCPKCKEKTRIGYKVTETGKKRMCRKCKEIIS
ncbi:MAG: 50S ribosomal protein L24 [Patescibacteria group bacterium]|jgi:large subunit ribosomal protein L24